VNQRLAFPETGQARAKIGQLHSDSLATSLENKESRLTIQANSLASQASMDRFQENSLGDEDSFVANQANSLEI
jgi:hypothetical protein